LKSKILNSLLIVTSSLGYLEWGQDNKSFLFLAEIEILSKVFTDPESVIHPFTLLPLAGQLLLLVTLFQKKPSKLLTYVGLLGIGILLAFMFAIGLLSGNYKIVLSTIPFLAIGFITLLHHRNKSEGQ